MILRLAEVIEPSHVEVLQFNERIYIESEKLFKLGLKAFSAGNYAKALSLIQYAISLSPLDIKLHIIKAKIHRMAGDLSAALEAIEGVALLFERSLGTADFKDNVTSSCVSTSTNQRRELPDDVELQRNLIINDMALSSAGKGDFIRAVVLLNEVLRNHSRIQSKAALAVTLMLPEITKSDVERNKAEEVRTVQYHMLVPSICSFSLYS